MRMLCNLQTECGVLVQRISNCHRPNNANNRTSGWYRTQGNTSLQKEKPVMASLFTHNLFELCPHSIPTGTTWMTNMYYANLFRGLCIYDILGISAWVMVRIVWMIRIVWILMSHCLFDLSGECMGVSNLVQTAFNLQLYGPLFLVIYSKWYAVLYW